jgi:hypothetical protein
MSALDDRGLDNDMRALSITCPSCGAAVEESCRFVEPINTEWWVHGRRGLDYRRWQDDRMWDALARAAARAEAAKATP